MYVHLLCSAYMICITPSGSELGELVGEGVCERKMGGGGGKRECMGKRGVTLLSLLLTGTH